jgi:hypothetical protein
MKKLLIAGAALLTAITTFARADTTVPALGDSYETFCQSIGGEGYALGRALRGGFGWNFERGREMAWFEQNEAQAILMEFTTSWPEDLLWKALKSYTSYSPEWSESKESAHVRSFRSADGQYEAYLIAGRGLVVAYKAWLDAHLEYLKDIPNQ